MKATNRLRVLRAEQRITQEELEQRTIRLRKRITQTRISLIENGSPAEAEEQKVLARALRVAIEDAFPEPVNA